MLLLNALQQNCNVCSADATSSLGKAQALPIRLLLDHLQTASAMTLLYDALHENHCTMQRKASSLGSSLSVNNGVWTCHDAGCQSIIFGHEQILQIECLMQMADLQP